MNAQDRHLIAIDLDDTVLSNLFSLDTDSVWALLDARDAGHIVMIATARPECITLPYYRLLGMNTLMSVMNGSYMYHPDDPSVPVFRRTIPAEVASRVTDAMQAMNMEHIWMEANNDLYSMDGIAPAHPYWRILFDASDLHICDAFPAVDCGRIYAVAANEQQAKDFRDMFANEALRIPIVPAADGKFHVHVWSATADKWYSVQDAAKYYGISPENIICFGDEMIDYKMTSEAAHGYVMCNGLPSIIQEAKEKGRGVTAYPCGKNGVGYELRRLLNL